MSRQAIHGDAMTVARFEILKGGGVAVHHHANEQISMVQRGRMKFVLNGVESIVGAGESVHIPAQCSAFSGGARRRRDRRPFFAAEGGLDPGDDK